MDSLKNESKSITFLLDLPKVNIEKTEVVYERGFRQIIQDLINVGFIEIQGEMCFLTEKGLATYVPKREIKTKLPEGLSESPAGSPIIVPAPKIEIKRYFKCLKPIEWYMPLCKSCRNI